MHGKYLQNIKNFMNTRGRRVLRRALRSRQAHTFHHIQFEQEQKTHVGSFQWKKHSTGNQPEQPLEKELMKAGGQSRAKPGAVQNHSSGNNGSDKTRKKDQGNRNSNPRQVMQSNTNTSNWRQLDEQQPPQQQRRSNLGVVFSSSGTVCARLIVDHERVLSWLLHPAVS